MSDMPLCMTHDAGGEEGQGPSREVKQEGGSKSSAEEEELDGEVRRATGGSSDLEEEPQPSQTTSRRKSHFPVHPVTVGSRVLQVVSMPRNSKAAVDAANPASLTCLS